MVAGQHHMKSVEECIGDVRACIGDAREAASREAAKFRRNTALGIGDALVRARSPITAVTASTIDTTPILTSSFLFPSLLHQLF